MKNKQFFYFLMIMICALLVVGCSSNSNTSNQSNGEETITLKVATSFPPTSATNEIFAVPWMEKVTERTNGRVQFEFYPSGQLGKGGDMLSLTRNGTTDLAMVAANYTPDTMPITNMLLGMPGLYGSAIQGANAYLDLLDQNEELVELEFSRHGVRFLGTSTGPTFLLWTKNKEVRSPEDIKNLKIRSSGGVTTDFLLHAGAVPITMEINDVFEGVERNVVGGLVLNADNIPIYGLEDTINHGIQEVGFSSTFVNLIINEKTFQKLPDDVKEVLIEVGREQSINVGKEYSARESSNLEKMSANGKMTELTAEEKSEWENLFEEFRQSWIAENKDSTIPFDEMLEAFIKSSEKFKE